MILVSHLLQDLHAGAVMAGAGGEDPQWATILVVYPCYGEWLAGLCIEHEHVARDEAGAVFVGRWREGWRDIHVHVVSLHAWRALYRCQFVRWQWTGCWSRRCCNLGILNVANTLSCVMTMRRWWSTRNKCAYTV